MNSSTEAAALMVEGLSQAYARAMWPPFESPAMKASFTLSDAFTRLITSLV